MSEQLITTCLFDLDGTLLQMDHDAFMKAYLAEFTAKCTSLGLDSKLGLHAFGLGIQAMFDNDGSVTNEVAFWQEFAARLGSGVDTRRQEFVSFYSEEFKRVRSVVQPSPLSEAIVSEVRRKGCRTVLATNPLFPESGTFERLSWAGLSPEMFDSITTYEYYHYTKPNTAYYEQILDRLAVDAEACLMVGNNVEEDMVAQSMGMDVFLVTDNLINPNQADITSFRRGSLSELLEYCKSMPTVG